MSLAPKRKMTADDETVGSGEGRDERLDAWAVGAGGEDAGGAGGHEGVHEEEAGMKHRRPRKPRLVPPRFAARRKRRSCEGVSAPRPWMMPTVKTEVRS